MVKWNYKQIIVNGKKILEHRYVMEKHLGRKLLRNEIVHHKDGNGKNNDINNLELTNNKDHGIKHHPKQGVWKTCPICKKNFQIKRTSFKYRERKGQKNFFCSRKCQYKSPVFKKHFRKKRREGIDEMDKTIIQYLKNEKSIYYIWKKEKWNNRTTHLRVKRLKELGYIS